MADIEQEARAQNKAPAEFVTLDFRYGIADALWEAGYRKVASPTSRAAASVVSEWREHKRTLTWRPEFTRALDALQDALEASRPVTSGELAGATHFVELTIEGGELHRAFRCAAPEDASCRRRPKDHEDRESWPAEEATEPGFPCWATEWVAAVGIEDAIHAYPDQVLASVPVTISYAEGVDITPTSSDLATREGVTVETTAALDALPIGAIVLSSDERMGLRRLYQRLYQRVGPHGWARPAYVGFSGPVPLPATVLYVPEAIDRRSPTDASREVDES